MNGWFARRPGCARWWRWRPLQRNTRFDRNDQIRTPHISAGKPSPVEVREFRIELAGGGMARTDRWAGEALALRL